MMPNENPLDALTPERLREIAAGCRQHIAATDETAKMIGATTDDTRTRMGADRLFYSQVANICEALAKAQEAMLARPNLTVECLKYSATDGAFIVDDDYDARGPVSTHPTLAAALGAVGDAS